MRTIDRMTHPNWESDRTGKMGTLPYSETQNKHMKMDISSLLRAVENKKILYAQEKVKGFIQFLECRNGELVGLVHAPKSKGHNKKATAYSSYRELIIDIVGETEYFAHSKVCIIPLSQVG